MVKEDLRQSITDKGYTESIRYDDPSFDDSIIGVSNTGKIVYAYPLMVEEYVRDLSDDDGFSQESDDEQRTDAVEWIGYNTVRATPYMASYGITPVIVDYNPDTEDYYDIISGDVYDLNDLDIKFDDKCQLLTTKCSGLAITT